MDLRKYIELIDDPLYKIKEDGTYLLSEQQAKAILELRLQRLTALGATEIGSELEDLADKIRICLDILKSREKIRKNSSYLYAKHTKSEVYCYLDLHNTFFFCKHLSINYH